MTHTTYTTRPHHYDHTKGPAMPTIRRLTTTATAALVLLTVTLLGHPATAFARVAPEPPDTVQPASVTDAPAQAAGSAGSPLWVFLLVALVAAAVTATAVLLTTKLGRRSAPRFVH